ncbi:MAG: efflux RND transporter periplasmic adaptor subunit [Nannocystaceae bacterium]
MRRGEALRRGALALLLAAGCNARAGDGPTGKRGESGETDGEEAKEQPTPVVAGELKRGDITNTIAVASTIEAERQVTVHAESTGRVMSLTVEEGDKVKKGERLAQIKYDAQASALNRASTSLEKAKADYERAQQLFSAKVIGKEELAQTRNAYELAQLDVRDRSREVRNTKVNAPFDGTIIKREVTSGAFVTSGAALFTVTDFSTLVARVYVPEKELDRIAVGQDAEIVGKAATGRQATGKIERIAPVVDAATGTVKVTVSLPDDKVGPAGFLPGMYAEVVLTTDHKDDVLLAPKSAVVHDEEQSYLFVIDGERAKRVRIEQGLADAEFVEITGDALKELQGGTKIAIAGQAGLKDEGLISLVDYQGRPVDEAGNLKKEEPASDEAAGE